MTSTQSRAAPLCAWLVQTTTLHSQAQCPAVMVRPSLPLLALALLAACCCCCTAVAARQPRDLDQRRGASEPLKWSPGENKYTLAFPFEGRDFYVYVPASYSAAVPASLVILLHGRGGQATDFARSSQFQARAEQKGFVLMYPQGSMGPNGTAWNAGLCCVHGVDDVGFIDAALSAVWSTLNLRADSVHVTGFSNGGYMTERLACTWPFIASAASISGNTILNPGLAAGLQACDIDYVGRLSMLHVHGDADTLVPWDNPGAAGRAFPTIPEDAAAWARRNKCVSGPVRTLNVTSFTNEVWSDCAGGAYHSVELVRNHGGGHVYPMDPTKGFMTTDYILEFFEKHSPNGF